MRYRGGELESRMSVKQLTAMWVGLKPVTKGLTGLIQARDLHSCNFLPRPCLFAFNFPCLSSFREADLTLVLPCPPGAASRISPLLAAYSMSRSHCLSSASGRWTWVRLHGENQVVRVRCFCPVVLLLSLFQVELHCQFHFLNPQISFRRVWPFVSSVSPRLTLATISVPSSGAPTAPRSRLKPKDQLALWSRIKKWKERMKWNDKSAKKTET